MSRRRPLAILYNFWLIRDSPADGCGNNEDPSSWNAYPAAGPPAPVNPAQRNKSYEHPPKEFYVSRMA